MNSRTLLGILLLAMGCFPGHAQGDDRRSASPDTRCSDCADWNEQQAPFRIHGDSYYVGPRGLATILIASPEGHVLIEANVRALGFRLKDIRLILNSHAHFDHAGGIAALQRVSGAEVAAHCPPDIRDLAAAGSVKHGLCRFAGSSDFPVNGLAVVDVMRVPCTTEGGAGIVLVG